MSDKLSDTSNHIKSKIEQLLINLPKKIGRKMQELLDDSFDETRGTVFSRTFFTMIETYFNEVQN